MAPTLAHVLGLTLPSKGGLTGRVTSEALAGGAPMLTTRRVVRSAPAANGFVTQLDGQDPGGEPYFDAAGMFGAGWSG